MSAWRYDVILRVGAPQALAAAETAIWRDVPSLHALLARRLDLLVVAAALFAAVKLLAMALGPAQSYVMTRFDGRRRMSWDIYREIGERYGDEVCETRIGESVIEKPTLR